MIPEGSAYLDASGRVLAACPTFRLLFGCPEGDASEAVRLRVTEEPSLAALVAGDGPDVVRLPGSGRGPAFDVVRVRSADGTLLRVRAVGAPPPADAAELSIQAIALGHLAGSVAHEVKNPLNAMALQLALLGDKIGSASAALASSCSNNLASLNAQIGRIDEICRRYVEIADPPAASGFDAGGMLSDVVSLFGHEARRRHVTVTCEASAGSIRAAGDPARAARLLLGLTLTAMRATPRGGEFAARASAGRTDAELYLEHTAGAPDPALEWMTGVVGLGVGAMGGRLEESSRDGRARTTVSWPKERAP